MVMQFPRFLYGRFYLANGRDNTLYAPVRFLLIFYALYLCQCYAKGYIIKIVYELKSNQITMRRAELGNENRYYGYRISSGSKESVTASVSCCK